MKYRNRIKLLVGLTAWVMVASALAQGPGGPGPGGRPGPPGGGFGDHGRPGRELGMPPDHFTRSPGGDWPDGGRRFPPPDGDDRRPPELDDRVVALGDAVSMVQERFNATAVKTDTVMDSGQLVYRIRLLSADRSRVWTVSVDARTGRIY